jgi:protein gp37
VDTLNWPVTTGCENIGGGCESCPSMWEYREKGWDYSLKEQPDTLYLPSFLNTSCIFTVALGSDLFHKDISSEFIHRVFKVMNWEHLHRFELLTKRSERLLEMSNELNFSSNISVGVTVESSEFVNRIEDLRKVNSEHRYISFLPLLGPIGDVNLDGISSAVIKPEEWGLKRVCLKSWIDDIKSQCVDQNVKVLDGYYIYKYDKEVDKCQVQVDLQQ